MLNLSGNENKGLEWKESTLLTGIMVLHIPAKNLRNLKLMFFRI